MKLTHEVSNLEKSAVCLTVTVSQKDVADAYNTTMAKHIKNAILPGFRRGHVPQSVLERKYGTAIKESAAIDIIEKSLQEIFADENMADCRPLGYSQPSIKTVPMIDTAQDMTYSVTYDVFPKVGTVDVSNITITEPQVEVTDEDVNKSIEILREQNALVVDKADDTHVEKGNVITMNYVELGDDGSEIAGTRREDFTFAVGSGANLYKIDDEVVGFVKGETRKVTKTYPEDIEDKHVAGRTVTLNVTVTAIKERKLPEVDDDFAQDVKDSYKTLDDLKAGLRANLTRSMDDKLFALKRDELLKQLIEKTPFDIPQSMLQMELNGRWDMMAEQYGTTPDQFEQMAAATGQTKEGVLKGWEAESENTLKRQIITDNLVKSRNVSVTPEEIEAEYTKMAEDSDAEVEDIKKYYEDPKAREYLIETVKERKMFDALFKEVKVQKGDKTTLDALMKNQ